MDLEGMGPTFAVAIIGTGADDTVDLSKELQDPEE